MNRKKLAGQGLLLLLLWLSACSRPESEEASHSRSLDAWPVPQGEEIPKATAKTHKDSTAYEWENGYLLLSWKTLAQVIFEWEFSGELEAEVPVPNFSKTVQALEGQPVQIKGYVIPMGDPDAPFTILSANPYKQCFFCGGAGPETVMDILLKDGEKRHFDMDETTAFRGRLRLNSDDFDYLNYILEDAEVVE